MRTRVLVWGLQTLIYTTQYSCFSKWPLAHVGGLKVQLCSTEQQNLQMRFEQREHGFAWVSGLFAPPESNLPASAG